MHMNDRIALRAPRTQRPVRAVLVVLSGVLLVIVGLLGMHTLSGASADASHTTSGVAALSVGGTAHGGQHGPTGATIAGGENFAAHQIADTAHADALHDPPPAGDTAPGHEAMAAACALALIVGMLLLVIPRSETATRTLRDRATAAAASVRAALPAPTPSLIVLSISRT
ncbi:DUF6153 family protein [Leucobacter sp. NPDC015123]|uniref:DUF6153 family protein n=1 Tax=Leucobacter sp. NPDC015123 TaxID=3364129 RepID=UPI0036F47400